MLAVNECAVSNGGCQHICIRNQVGHHCECSHGYILGFDHKSCLGITLLGLVTVLLDFTESYLCQCVSTNLSTSRGCIRLQYCRKFIIKSPLKIPPHISHVATLPCEVFDTFLTHIGQKPHFLSQPEEMYFVITLWNVVALLLIS